MTKHLVLIADPEPSVLAHVKQVLTSDGYTVGVANTSHDAIELARTRRPDLLIINPQMPALSGVEAASRISRTAKCKVLFLSALATDPDFREMLQGLKRQGCRCSAHGVPFEDEDILAQVRSQIGPATTAKSSQLRSLLAAAVALVLIATCTLILRIGSNSSVPRNSPIAPTASSAKSTLPATDPGTGPKGQSAPAVGTTPLRSTGNAGPAPLSTNPSKSAEALSLRAKIEQEGATLREMETNLSNLNRRIDALKTEINSDEASLREMKRKSNLKVEASAGLYKTIRQRHDTDIHTYNALLDESRSSSRNYRELLKTIKEQIDRYNILVRSR